MNELMAGFIPSGQLAEEVSRAKKRPAPTQPYEFQNDYYPLDKAQAVIMFEEECRKLRDNMDGVRVANKKVCLSFSNKDRKLTNGRLALWIVEVHFNKHSPITIEYNLIKKNRKLAPKKRGKKKPIKITKEHIDAGFYRMEIPSKKASRHYENPKPLGEITHKDKLKMIKIDLSKEFEIGVDETLSQMKKFVREHQNGS